MTVFDLKVKYFSYFSLQKLRTEKKSFPRTVLLPKYLKILKSYSTKMSYRKFNIDYV